MGGSVILSFSGVFFVFPGVIERQGGGVWGAMDGATCWGAPAGRGDDQLDLSYDEG